LRTGEEKFESYRQHHSRSERRDCEIESGAPVVGGYTYSREEISTKEHGATDTQNISGRQEKNRSGTAGALGKNQGSKEGVVRHFESAGELSQLSQLHLWVLLFVASAGLSSSSLSAR